jgi:RimJ/RimL family protein N-acetyltransferase
VSNVLTSERLILSPTGLDDYPDSAALWGDQAVVRYLGGQVSTPQQAWQRILRNIGHWVVLDYGYWTVRERTTDRFVGEVGFADFRRDGVGERFTSAPEAGWVLSPWAHGRGYASEAVAAAHAWFDERFPGERAVAMIDVENAASQRVAARFGYAEYARIDYNASPVILYERRR